MTAPPASLPITPVVNPATTPSLLNPLPNTPTAVPSIFPPPPAPPPPPPPPPRFPPAPPPRFPPPPPPPRIAAKSSRSVASEAAPVASTFPTPGMLMNTPAMIYFFPGKMRI